MRSSPRDGGIGDRLAPRLGGGGPGLYLTAAEAFPEFERAFLNAEREIWAGFRIFDLATRLRATESREIGAQWFDLVLHTLRRGIRLNLWLADFDPVFAADLHAGTWRTMRQFAHVREAAGPGAMLSVIPAMHPASPGWLPRRLMMPLIRRHMDRLAEKLNGDDPDERARFLGCAPGLRPCLAVDAAGTLRPVPGMPGPLHPATHHQKLAVFDRKLLYVGGLDLDERRFDTRRHDRPAESTWHDVQCLVRGPVVAEAQAHLESLSDSASGQRPPPVARHLLTTLSAWRNAPFSIAPRSLSRGIERAHLDLTAEADELIYLETQFFRHRPLARALARAARARPGLSLILILPAAPDDVAFERNKGMDARLGEHLQARCIAILRKGFGDRAFIGSPAQRRPADGSGRDRLQGAPIVYVHAKVSVFDDRAAILSSANLNGRSLRWDTEAGVCLRAPEDVRHVRARCFDHWLPMDAPAECHAPATAVRAWAALAQANRDRAPRDRRGFLLPHEEAPARRFGRPLPGIPDEMV